MKSNILPCSCPLTSSASSWNIFRSGFRSAPRLLLRSRFRSGICGAIGFLRILLLMPRFSSMMQIDRNTPVTLPGSAVQLLFGAGVLSQIPGLVRALNAKRILLVTDDGIKEAGHVERALRSLYHAHIVVRVFDEVIENPTTHTVAKGLRLAMA